MLDSNYFSEGSSERLLCEHLITLGVKKSVFFFNAGAFAHDKARTKNTTRDENINEGVIYFRCFDLIVIVRLMFAVRREW